MQFNDASSAFNGSNRGGHLGLPFKKQHSMRSKASAISAMSGRTALSKRIQDATPDRLKNNEILKRMQERMLNNIEAIEKGEPVKQATKEDSDKPKKKKKSTKSESEDENAVVEQKGVKDLLSKKFLLEVKKNMSQRLIQVATHKSRIMERRQQYRFIDTVYRI